MGLFSFLKNAGSKIFNRKSVTAEKVAAEPEKVELSRADALKAEVAKHGLAVDNLDIDLGQQVIVSGLTQDNATREKVILALGNVEGVSSVDDRLEVANPEPEAVFYTVQKGDSLSKIAKAQYGNAMAYNAIFEANKPMLTHPDKIYPGQVLRIPPQQ
jgi:nucleoid-associated protein YgaU